MKPTDAIGFFDSGFGGLTIMKEVTRLLPHENLIYFADTAHLPYGNKSANALLQLSLEAAAFLMSKKIKLLVIACHTACSYAFKTLQKTIPIPVLGVIQPSVQLAEGIERLVILGTKSTIESGVYQSQLCKSALAKACPLFVPLIEEGFHNTAATRLIAESYLKAIQGEVDAALLACTHYSLLRPILQEVLGARVTLLDPAELCALQLKNLLEKTSLLNPQTGRAHSCFYVSDDPEKFRRFGEIFFGSAVENIEKK